MAQENKKRVKKQQKASAGRYIYRALLLLMLLGIGWNVFAIYHEYGAYGTKAPADGRKLIYDVKTDKIELADDFDKQQLLEKGYEKQKNKNASNKENSEKGKNPESENAENKNTPEAKGTDEVGPPIAGDKAPSENGFTPSDDYKNANLGIIIVNLGLKQAPLDIAKTLPKEVAFAFSPYARELPNKIRMTKNDGREILLDVEFESANYPLTDSGPYTIHSFFDASQNIYRLQTTLALADNYIGVLSMPDEVITDKRDVITPIMEYLKKKNLFLAYHLNAKNISLESDVKPLAANILMISHHIDEEMSLADVQQELTEVKQELLSGKRVVLTVSPYTNHLNELYSWLKSNLGAKIQIAPISQFVSKN